MKDFLHDLTNLNQWGSTTSIAKLLELWDPFIMAIREVVVNFLKFKIKWHVW